MTPIRFQQLLDFHPIIYCVIDRNNCFSYINRTATDILGYQLNEVIGQCFLNFVVEQDQEKTNTVLHQLHQSQVFKHFENHCYHKNGTVVTIQWTSQWDADNQLLYSIGHTVAESIKVKQLQYEFSVKLKQASLSVSETFDQITDGFFKLDEQWRFIYANKATEQILNIPKEQLLAQVLWDVFPGAKGSQIEKEYRRCREQQQSIRFETFYTASLNKWFEVSAYPSNGGISAVFRDISERKQVEDEMRKLSLILKHTNNLVIICNSHGAIKWINDAFIKKTGYTLSEIQGTRLADLLSGPETDKHVIERIRTKCHNGETFSEEVLFYTKNKEKLWVYLTGQHIYDAQGKVKELVSIQTDITERKQLEVQLDQERKAYQRLATAATIQAQEQERSEIGKELHDNVNQLLTTIKLYLEVTLSTNESRENLTKRSIQLLQDAINEIRNLSKQLSAPTIGEISLADSVKELCGNVAATKQFTLSVDTTGVDELTVDEELHLAIYRIIQEHLTNIMRHAEAASVYVNVDFDGNAISLLILDDGKGFDTNQKRNGIGITNMCTRAESMNGELHISSKKGKGCVLTAQFPLLQSQ